MTINMDNVYINPKDYNHLYRHPQDINFWINIAEKRKAKKILELGVGECRIALPLAECGFHVTGIDISDNMLEAAKNQLDKSPDLIKERITLLKKDMIDFDLPCKDFDLIIVPSLTFQHLLSLEDQISCMRCCREHLKNQGALIIDVFNPDMQILAESYTNYPKMKRNINTVTPDTGENLIRYDVCLYQPDEQILDVQATVEYYKDNILTKKMLFNHIGHIFFPRELHLLYALADLSIVAYYGNHDFTEYKSVSPRQIIIGEKVN